MVKYLAGFKVDIGDVADGGAFIGSGDAVYSVVNKVSPFSAVHCCPTIPPLYQIDTLCKS